MPLRSVVPSQPPAPLAPFEDARLAALRSLGLLETPSHPALDAIVQAAADVCNTPIALLTLLDEQRQWFKSCVGLPGMTHSAREDAFCAYAILDSGTMEVPDATQDPRFRDNPLVRQTPNIRFYAGAPIVVEGGHALGTLCVIDRVPRALSQPQHAALASLARSAATLMQQANQEGAPANSATQQENSRLARLYESTPAMLHTVDAEGRLLSVSDTWLSRLGYGRGDVIGRPLTAFLTASSQERLREMMPVFLATGRCKDVAYQMITKGGQLIDVVLSALLDHGGDGVPSRSVAVIVDVTQRLRVERELVQDRRRLSSLIDGIGAAVWELNVQTGALRVNARWREALGLTTDDPPTATLQSWWHWMHDDDVWLARSQLDAIRSGASERYQSEARMRTVGGRMLWVLDRGSVLSRTQDGRAEWVVGTQTDITEARQLATDLAQQHELLRVTLQSIGDGVITTDAKGLVGWLNPAAERMTGWRNAEACGRPADDVFRVVDAATGLPAGGELGECLTQGRVSRPAAERDLMSREGARVGIEDTAAPIRNDDGHIFGAVLVFRDVTEQRRIEAGRAEREQELRVVNAALERLARHLAKARDSADRANRAKSRFLAGMSHELRTPLNGILGYTQLLKLEGGLGTQQQARVDAMLAAGSHLLEMVNSVLDISEIEAEHVELRVVEADLREIVGACIDQVRPAAAAKALALRVVIAPSSPDMISTDPVRLRQILINLLGNAIKFTPAGSVELRICAGTEPSAVRIEVVDTGPGIPPEQREHLFVEFERLDAERVEMIEGSGLGLALSARLAALMEGRLGYEDGLGGGSVFWLELPLQLGQPRAAPPSLAKEGFLATRAAQPLRVLVVDDVAMNRDIAQTILRIAGHAVECAENGAAAVAAVAGGSFDVVLMDVRMPGMDGLEATRRIRNLDGPGRDVPIIGLTAQAFAEQVDECHLVGMDGHLPKPYAPAALIGAIMSAADQGYRRIRPRIGALSEPEAPQLDAMVGAAFPVLDGESVGRLSSFLPPEAVLSYLQLIAARAEGVALHLERWAPPEGNEALADAVHAMTGCAGMFGCARLASVGSQFENALRRGGTEAWGLRGAFRSALDATIPQIRSRTLAAAVATPGGLQSAPALQGIDRQP